MPKFAYGEHLTKSEFIQSAKLGTTAAQHTDADVGKAVKLVGASRFGLCADGDNIEGFITSVEQFTVDTYSFGGVQVGGFKDVVVTGPIAIGDYVVASSNTSKLKKAPSMTADATTHPKYLWRYVEGAVNAGAVDCVGVIQRVA